MRVWDERNILLVAYDFLRAYTGVWCARLFFSLKTGLFSLIPIALPNNVLLSYHFSSKLWCFACRSLMIFFSVGFLTLFIGFASCAHINFKCLLLSRTHAHFTSYSFVQFHNIHAQTHELYCIYSNIMWYDTLRQQTKEKSDSMLSSIDCIMLVFVVVLVVLWFAFCFYPGISFRKTYSNDLRAFERRLDRSFRYYSFHRTLYLYCWVRAWHTDVSMIVPSYLFRHSPCNSANHQCV